MTAGDAIGGAEDTMLCQTRLTGLPRAAASVMCALSHMVGKELLSSSQASGHRWMEA